MSIEFTPVIICDTCGTRYVGMVARNISQSKSCAHYAKHRALMTGWTIIPRGRYNADAHYCKECADKPMKPISRKNPSALDAITDQLTDEQYFGGVSE